VFSIPSPSVSSPERLRYFARQLLTPDDLTQEQEYFRARMRRHNRFLHGWGVVCGCQVRATATPWTVSIDAGYVLGPRGDEIAIDTSFNVDLSQQDLAGNVALPCADPLDPWCGSVRAVPPLRQTLYLAVAYAESETRAVRVQTAGCGCDGGQCEFSRTRDGFVVRLLSALPASYAPMAPRLTGTDCPGGGVRPCPPLPADPWVILATIQPQSQTITETDIDNFTNRRYAATFADWWYTCTAGGPTPTPTPTPAPTPSPTPTPTPPPGVITLQSLTLNPSVVQPGDTSIGTITLSSPAIATGTQVGIASDNPSVANVPNAISVPAGSTSAQFTVTTQAVGVARVTAALGTSTAQATISVRRSKSPVEKIQVDKVSALEKVTDKVLAEKLREKVQLEKAVDAKLTDVVAPGPQIRPTGLASPALAGDSGTRRAFIAPAERPPVGVSFLTPPDGHATP